MKMHNLNPKWRHSNITLPLCSAADIFHVISFRRGEDFSVWPHIASHPPHCTFSSFCLLEELLLPCPVLDVFQLQTEISSVPFIVLLSFQTVLAVTVIATAFACKHEEWDYNF